MLATFPLFARAVWNKFRRKTKEGKISQYFQSAQELVALNNSFKELRGDFIQRYPRFTRFVPRGIASDAVIANAEAAVKIAVEGTEEERRRFVERL
jgi:hypothetical protein